MRIKIRKLIIFFSALLLLVGITVYAAGTEWESIHDGLYQDPITGNFKYESIDRKKASNVYYKTQGFTITAVGPDGQLMGENYQITVPLTGPYVIDEESETGVAGYKKYTYTIPYDEILKLIFEKNKDWYNSIVNPVGEVKIQVDAIIAVHDKNKYGSSFPWSGRLNPSTGEYQGDLWDLNNWKDLKHLWGWRDPNCFDSHYGKQMVIVPAPPPPPEDDEEDEDPVDPVDPVDPEDPFDPYNPRTVIGKEEPEYYTYNYSTSGQFDIGDGIPTSEYVTNGYTADGWYGTATVNNKKARKTYYYNGWISWPETIKVEDDSVTLTDGNGNTYHPTVDVAVTRREPYYYQVQREVGYWYIEYASFYDLMGVMTTNQVFPDDGKYEYNSLGTTNITCTVNGVDITTITDQLQIDYIPNDNYHVDWPVQSTSSLTIHGGSKDAAINEFRATAEGTITASKDIYVRNDHLQVEWYYTTGYTNETYMDGTRYQFRDFESYPENPRSFSYIQESDYGEETEERVGKIPSTLANGDYYTCVNAGYEQFVCGSHLLTSDFGSSVWHDTGKWHKYPNVNEDNHNPPHTGKEMACDIHGYHHDDSKITLKTERILAGYEQNEAIVVHTPTISPVIITNPDSTQLVPGGENSNMDYQLLLDGTYTIEFTPEEHMEHIGYPQMSQNLYNKYCKFKQVAFPFVVQLDGDIHTPDNNTTDCNGNPKLAGYTKWIDLPDFSINGFYIPPWTTEDDEYVIQFRVAPENVESVDPLTGEVTNHIDDQEWLLNHTMGGEPIYKYVSYYSVNVQISGRIYDFQAVGINDKDTFYGKNPDTGKSWGYGYLAQNFPFCPTYQEKRSGIYNRLGGNYVRYTVDGNLTNRWNPLNTLPFSVGRSQAMSGEGTLRKGNTFAFTVRTIANLWDEQDDYIIIKPTFRYISPEGITKEVNVYYNTSTPDGEKKLHLVPYGSDVDKANVFKTSISDERFDGSYYTEDLSINRTIPQDDADYSRLKYNAYMKEKNPTYPDDVFQNTNAYLNKKEECYCLSQITLNNRLRLLTGNVEQLEMNLAKNPGEVTYIKDKTDAGSSYEVKEATNPQMWDQFRMSMQTWFGEYYIPNQIFVTDATFTEDADGDGIEETYDDVYDYIAVKGSIDGTEDFFIEDGYLVVNFEITTYNNGQPHLTYAATNKDQWVVEGMTDKVKVGDPDVDNEITIPVKPGDIAIVDLGKSVNDFWYVGFNRIN
ncbi:MAG: hypothetical protein UHN47_03420 [Lachnospiraceae bacterium]|nr:hypothetical protein [Lachnospiraceae bacterium]